MKTDPRVTVVEHTKPVTALEVLISIEWVQSTHTGIFRCPCCWEAQDDGHEGGCGLGQVLGRKPRAECRHHMPLAWNCNACSDEAALGGRPNPRNTQQAAR